MKAKESRRYTATISSAVAWTYQDLNINTDTKSEELPSMVIIHNTGSESVAVKLMDKTEANDDSRTGTIIPAGQGLVFEIEENGKDDERELPFYRVGSILLAAGSTTIAISGLRYQVERV